MQPKKFEHVTNRQGVQLADFAREEKVSREQFAQFLKDEQRRKKFFEEIRNGNDWFLKLQKSAEKIGGRVYLIPKLVVDYTRPHNEAAMAGGPQTGSNYNVLKVADKYQPSENKATEETIVLFNWPKGGGSYSKAIEWGLSNGLLRTTPHVSFAIGEQKLNLNYELGPNPMYVVETTGCSFEGHSNACYVWWNVARRESNLSWQGDFGYGLGWFAFRKK